MVQPSKKNSGQVFEWLNQDGCHTHLKTRHLCMVFEWSTSLEKKKSNKNIFLLYKTVHFSGPFEKQTTNRMVKDHSKTEHMSSPFEYRKSPIFEWSL
jgi:hypothetical protein